VTRSLHLPNVAFLALALASVLLVPGCGMEIPDGWTAAGEPESVAPPEPVGAVEGFLADVGSSSFRDALGRTVTWHHFAVRWGSPAKATDFLLVDSTELTLHGGMVHGSAAAKAAALSALDLTGNMTNVSVSYEASSGAIRSSSAPPPSYRLPLATRVEVAGDR
jgi:hypothetical protein